MATATSISRLGWFHDERDVSQIGWLSVAIAGALILLAGLVALIWPTVATIAVEMTVGWMLVLGGLFGLLTLFRAHGKLAFIWNLITSLLAMAAGVLLLTRPVAGMISLTLVLTVYFFAQGAILLLAALDYRQRVPAGWVGLLAAGVIDLLLGFAILAGFPATALWALGLVTGVNLVTWGAALLFFAIAVRSRQCELGRHRAS